MGFLHCCGGLKRSVSYAVQPQDGFVFAELDILDACPVCGSYVAQLTRIDYNNKVSVVRKTKSHAKKLIAKLEPSILYRYEYKYSPLKSRTSNFYLSYNEFGQKKKCYSNISNLNLGKEDNFSDLASTNPILFKRLLKPVTVSI